MSSQFYSNPGGMGNEQGHLEAMQTNGDPVTSSICLAPTSHHWQLPDQQTNNQDDKPCL